jgi:hypothetical protein
MAIKIKGEMQQLKFHNNVIKEGRGQYFHYFCKIPQGIFLARDLER